MATTKKATAKKSVAKTVPTKRATTTKSTSTTKKPAAKKSSAAAATPQVRSFRVSPDYPSFGTFKISRQTIYWVIIISLIIFLQLWILDIQMETATYIENELTSIELDS